MRGTLLKNASSYTKASGSVRIFHAVLFVLNILLLFWQGFRTLQAWADVPFAFAETLTAYPSEPEFENQDGAERQMWAAMIFQVAVYAAGAFACYVLFIKSESLLMNLAAPLFVAFLVLTGESVNFVLPAMEKAREIRMCQSLDIKWNKKTHSCNFMELEKKRTQEAKTRLKLRKNGKRR